MSDTPQEPGAAAPAPGTARPRMMVLSSWLGLANAVCGVVVVVYGIVSGRAETARTAQALVAQGYFPTEQAAAGFTDTIYTWTGVLLAVITVLWLTLGRAWQRLSAAR